MKRWIALFCAVFLLLIAAPGTTPTHALEGGACPKAPAPRLKANTQAKIVLASSKDTPGAFLKGQASHTGPVLRYLPVGTVVDVVSGPTCGDDNTNWWNVKLAGLTGFMDETVDKAYALEPFTGTAPDPLPSTVAGALACIAPHAAPAATQAATEAATSQSGTGTLRVAYSSLQGDLFISDDAAVGGKSIAKFDPPPLSVDLSPDGSSVLVATYNGIYWVDASVGAPILIADATKFQLQESSWPDSVKWLPDGHTAAVEITDKSGVSIGYEVWEVPVDNGFPPFRVDTGAEPAGGIERSPLATKAVLLSNNDISEFPQNDAQDPQPLVQYVPRMVEGDTGGQIVPAVTWSSDEKGFYTYIPVSDEAPLDDPTSGHMLYVSADSVAKDLGKIPKVLPADYVIVSGDGQAVLVFSAGVWTIRDPKTGAITRTVPPSQLLFGWTPDNKGVVYRSAASEAKYLGVDGSATSPYVPSLTNLYDIKWLADGTALFVAKGKDNKLSLSVRPPNRDAAFMGVLSTLDAYNGRLLSAKPGAVVAPTLCK